MVNNNYKTVGYNGYGNMNANSNLCGIQEPFDFEMLLKSFEEQLDELPFLNFKSREMLGIDEKNKFTIFFLVIVSDRSERHGIFLF